MSTQDFDKLYNYNLNSENKIIEDLIINLGTDNIGRFSCANHKISLVVRSSIIKHPVVSEDLVKLNSFASHINNSIEFNKIFANLNCRLGLKNSTR